MTKQQKRFRCPQCGSLSIILWGKRGDQQRYKCRDCGASFVKHREDVGRRNRFVWFRKEIAALEVEQRNRRIDLHTRQCQAGLYAPTQGYITYV